MLISLFMLTDIYIQTSDGYNSQLSIEDINQQFNKSVTFILLGIVSFLTFISLVGWLNSRWMGVITTIMGIATFITIMSHMN